MRHTPFGNWSGNYDIEKNSSPIYIKVKFSDATEWSPRNTPINSGVAPGALVVLQPQVSNGYYANIWILKNITDSLGQGTLQYLLQICRFPSDNCGTNFSWSMPRSSQLPKAFYLKMQGDSISVLDSAGNIMSGVRDDTHQNTAMTLSDSRMNFNFSTLDISVQNTTPVILQDVFYSRMFIP